MMYRPLNANWVQPFAAFATCEAAKGDILAKLVLQAVIKLEDAGAEVLNVVCDGAKPNRKMWKGFGITGNSDGINNKITHPCDDNRNLYFSSDVPHLFKCIRNHFMAKNTIEFQGEVAKFSHYQRLYEIENSLAPGLRYCPKLTKSHINPNNFEKMVVCYATQLFSNHVGNGLTFYMREGVSGLEDASGTIAITMILNKAFDALNAKIPCQGIRPKSEQFKVLQDFLFIVTTEQEQRKLDRKYIAFASDETLEGLRVTVATTVEIIEYAVNTLKFAYILTVKFNQDALEKFFGLIRAAGGREEHPTIKNFLYLYRLLSMYSPCKRVVRGNIRGSNGTNDETVLCSYRANLKASAAAVVEEQRKIDEEICAEIDRNIKLCSVSDSMPHLADHNYSVTVTPGFTSNDWNNPTGTLSRKIVFHLCGFVAYKFRKLSKCQDCITALYESDPRNWDTGFRTLVDLVNQGPLHYPSPVLFKFIAYALEPSICNIIDSCSFFGDMLLECLKNLPVVPVDGLGCRAENHRSDLIQQLIPFYVTMRFNFWCRTQRDKIGKGKETKVKRKESKLL